MRTPAPTALCLLATPAGPICSLDCEYRFFPSEEMLYPGDRPRYSAPCPDTPSHLGAGVCELLLDVLPPDQTEDLGEEENDHDGDRKSDVEGTIEEREIVAVVGHEGAPEVLLEVVPEDQPQQDWCEWYVHLAREVPDEHGLGIVESLRSDPGADVIAITAARDVPNIRAAMQHGALFYIVKPFRFAAFRECLEAYARLRSTLNHGSELTQADIDNAFATLRTTTADLPKGLSAQTLDAIERTLHQSDQTLSAEEVAHLTGVSRVTARRYLIFLVESGRAQVRSEYGTPGRPTHLYAPIGSGDEG